MRDLMDAIKTYVGAMLAQTGQPRHATVTAYDPVNFLAKVTYHPGDAESAWLPVSTQALGNGWGLLVGLSPGQQVFVMPDNGDAEHGVIVSGTHNLQAMPPQVPSVPMGAATPIQSGECALVHASGAVIRLTAVGIYSRGMWMHEGTFSATGNVTAGLNTGDQVDLLMHTHGYLPGSGGLTQTAVPTPGT